MSLCHLLPFVKVGYISLDFKYQWPNNYLTTPLHTKVTTVCYSIGGLPLVIRAAFGVDRGSMWVIIGYICLDFTYQLPNNYLTTPLRTKVNMGLYLGLCVTESDGCLWWYALPFGWIEGPCEWPIWPLSLDACLWWLAYSAISGWSLWWRHKHNTLWLWY